jgi:hypothetical protein
MSRHSLPFLFVQWDMDSRLCGRSPIMSQIRILFVAVLAGIAAILVLGRLSVLEPQVQEHRKSAAVSAPERQQTLSDDNLADAIAGLRMNHRITRVGWDHSILTLDLTLRDGAGGAESLWRDMAVLIRFSFGEAANVHQTLVRVYRDTDGRRTLLFYGDPRREDWTDARIEVLRPPEAGADEPFRRLIRLSVTPSGERWLRNLAIS